MVRHSRQPGTKRWAVCMILGVLTASTLFSETIVIGLRPIAPYVYTGPMGRLGGIEYEIIRAAFAASGYSIKVELYPLARLIETFKSGSLDAAATALPETIGEGVFSDSYIEYLNVAVTLNRSNLSIETVADLDGLSVAAFQRAVDVLGPEFSAIMRGNPRYAEHAQQVTQIRQLFSYRVDVAVGDRRILRTLIKDPATGVDDSMEIRIFPVFSPTRYRVVFRDTDLAEKFNSGLAKIRADGTYARIVASYPY